MAVLILSLYVCVSGPSFTQALGASLGPRQPGWKDHYFRAHPSARASAAKFMKQRQEAIKVAKEKFEEKRKLQMKIDNKYGALYYAYGEDSSTWLVNGVENNYADVDCDWVPGWFQKLDNFPATDWSYDPSASNAITGASTDLMGLESVCAGENTPQDPAIPNALPTIPCALICLPYQAGVSSADTQTGDFMMAAETKASIGEHFTGEAPAAPLVLAQEGYDVGYLGYGYAAPDPFGAGPICETYIKDCA